TVVPDGTAPAPLVGRDAVQLTFPAVEETRAGTIKAAGLEAKGDAKDAKGGLTNAVFTGAAVPACLDQKTWIADCDVDYREKSGATATRIAKAARLEVAMKPGMSSIDEAQFTRGVRFEDGQLGAFSG